MKPTIIAALLLATTLSQPVVAHEPPSAESLPSPQQERYLKQLGRTLAGNGDGAALSVQVDGPGAAPVERPYQAASQLLILLDPDLSPAEVAVALRDHRLQPVKTMPQIGALTVSVADRLAVDSGTSVPVAHVDELSIDKIARELAEDRRFISVTPNAVVTPFQNQAQTVADDPAAGGAGGERTDWGIADGGFDRVWPSMTSPFLVGVIDVGFAEHEDLDTAPGLPQILPRQNHGNHVAGIMCAKHNQVGVRGALKNCRVTVAAASMVSDTASVEHPDLGIATTIGAFIESTLEFMEANPNARVINLSLGYNWMPNYQIDPRSPGEERIRDVVRLQGQFFKSLLAYAKRRNIALVSAAGNDSEMLSSPLPAIWASPFNMGSQLIEEADGWTNGLVVQAHDRQGQRAAFSNVGGHISCPGVDVLSALATSNRAYGLDSGTSMAAPYCAAGLSAVRALRPQLTLRQAIDCLRAGPGRVDGVPKMDVDFAVNRCQL